MRLVLLKMTELRLFIFTFLIYCLFFAPYIDDNENSRYNLIRSVVEDHSLRIDKYRENSVDVAYYNGHYYSDKPIGPSILGIPIYFVLYNLAKILGISLNFSVYAYLLRVLIISLPSAFGVMLLYRISSKFVKRRELALIAVLFYAFGSGAFTYSVQFYGHQLAASLLFLSFYLVYGRKNEGDPTWQHLALGGILCGFAVLSDFSALLMIIILYIYTAYRLRDRRQFLYMASILLPLSLLLFYNKLCFDSFWTNAYSYHVLPHRLQGFMGLVGFSWDRLYGVLLSPARGLLFYSPFFIFTAFGWYSLIRQRQYSLVLLTMAIAVSQTLLNASLIDWQGGYGIGPRYLVLILPFLIIPIFAFIPRVEQTRSIYLFLALGEVSVLFHTLANWINPRFPLSHSFPLGEFIPQIAQTGSNSLMLTNLLGIAARSAGCITLLLILILLAYFLGKELLGILKDTYQVLLSLVVVIVLATLMIYNPQAKESSEGLINIGNMFFQMGEYRKAAEFFHKAYQSEPDPALSGQIAYLIGETYRVQGMHQQALEYFKMAAELCPHYYAPYYRMGIYYQSIGKYDRAISNLKMALKHKSRFPEAHNNLGIAYAATGQLDGAVNQFKQALRLRHNYSQAHYNLGQTFIMLKEYEKAKDSFKKALELEPGFTGARAALEEVEKILRQGAQ